MGLMILISSFAIISYTIRQADNYMKSTKAAKHNHTIPG